MLNFTSNVEIIVLQLSIENKSCKVLLDLAHSGQVIYSRLDEFTL